MLRASLLVLLSGCATTTFPRAAVEVRTLEHDSTNTYLVTKDGHAFLFDSGYEKNADALEADVKAAGVDPATLKAVIVSHGHADHAGGARHFHEKYGTPVVLGAGDETMFSTGKNEPLCPVGFIARSRHQTDETATYTGSTADTVVADTLDLGALTGIDGTVVRVGGHTRGSLVVVVGDVVLVGDLLRGSIVGSGAETHFFMCDLEQNKRDIKRVLDELAPEAKLVFVGHFGPVTPEAVRAHFGL